MDTDKIYQRIGEFVVSYQWIEDKFRQIGWLILDPNRADWPPKSLRNESSKDLIDKVAALYLDLIERLGPPDREGMTEHDKGIELARMKYNHVETLVALGIVGVVAVGGLVCIVLGKESGPTIIVGVLGLIGGAWAGAKHALKGSGRQ